MTNMTGTLTITTTVAPTRSLEQRITALALANDIRRRRAAMKRELHAASLPSAAAAMIGYLVHPPTWLGTMLVRDLLLQLPRIGPARVDRILIATQTNPRKTVAGVSQRQRAALTTWLGAIGS